jgi:hypothetical protein
LQEVAALFAAKMHLEGAKTAAPTTEAVVSKSKWNSNRL